MTKIDGAIMVALAERILKLERDVELFEQKWREAGQLANAEREGRQKAEAELEGYIKMYGTIAEGTPTS